jgi:hypothetical protein
MPENDWYGHSFVLARYCSMPMLHPPIWGSLHHGWAPTYAFDTGRLRQLPRLVWNEEQASAARASGHREPTIIGAPFLYAAASIAESSPTMPSGAGTLLMPRHSTPGTRITAEHRHLIAEVEATEEPPYTVALYYLELAEVRRNYEEAGWRLISFGSRDDDLFIYRLIAEMAQQRTVVANGISTALWYGAHLGRRVRVLKTDPDPAVPGRTDDAASNARRWPTIYAEGIEGGDATALAAVELGASSLLEPDELRAALGWTSYRRLLAVAGRSVVDLRHGRALRRGVEAGGG